jgi:hypothetical protein
MKKFPEKGLLKLESHLNSRLSKYKHDYYVYIYLNPEKKGMFYYKRFPMCFLYEPFYVGKGRLDRIYTHLWDKNLNKNINKLKTEKIIELTKKGYNLYNYINKFKDNMLHSTAIDIEQFVIEKIGRIVDNKGPLYNLSLRGSKNVSSRIYKPLTNEQKSNLSKKLKGRVFSELHRLRKSMAQTGPKNHRYGKKTPDFLKEILKPIKEERLKNQQKKN